MWEYLRVANVSVHLTSLLKVMVLLDDAPVDFVSKLIPPHAEITSWGRQIRALRLSYPEQ
jgi:hypothetical protein